MTYTATGAAGASATLTFVTFVVDPAGVRSVRIHSNPASGDTYALGETIEVDVHFDRVVAVMGTPRLALTIGSVDRQVDMDFVFGNRKGMKFSYVVQEGDRDVDGISVGPNALTLNGGTVRDADGWSVDLDLGEHAITDDVRHKVDGSLVNAAPQQSQSFAVYFLNRDGQPRDREPYTITLASESEVYLIATNTTDRALSSRIELFGNVAEQKDERLVASVSSLGMGAPCTYCVDQFSRFEPRQSQLPSMPRRSLSEGDRFTFHEDIYHHQVPATLRDINTDGTTTLAIWVADDSWGDCSHCVNEELVNQFADRFLRPGSANDVYDWVTAIFGAPWGQHNEQHLIPPDYSDQFHILIYDIGPNAGGSYNPFNNMRTHPHSSERLMFYLNAPILRGIPTALSIAAHELQHVVYFYQKVVLRNVPWHRTPEERWFNEMVSMVAMDLISDKIMSNTPRGVPYDDPTGGDKLITNSLITAYNHYNYLQVDTVIDDSAGYAVFYALGAYLARAYGGAALFRDIIHNDKAGIEAIEAGLHTQGHDVSFDDVLQDWAVANLLSDNTAAPHPFRYNSGTWSESEAGGVTFRLESINLFNYRFWYGDRHQDGPRFFTVATFNESAQQPHSNRFVALGDVSGEVRLALTAPRDNRLTVVVKGGTASVVTNRGKLVVPVAAYP